MSEQTSVASPEPNGKQKAEDKTTKRVVVILGSGRSGTSLCAKILSRLGIAMETTLHRPNEMNPEGYFEDAQLVEINKRLLAKLAPVSGVAPRSDVADAEIGSEMRELRAHLKERTLASHNVWGFKDPRVSMLLPLYRRAFQAEGIVPNYIFCARSAGAVVESLMQASGKSRELCEQMYFSRTFLALRDSAANCYVLHYEKLLESPSTQIGALWTYVGEKHKPSPIDDKQCENLVEKKYNRSSLMAQKITNPLACRMEALIENMEGTQFNRDSVLEELREIGLINSGYQAWIDITAKSINDLKSSLVKPNEAVEKKEKEWASKLSQQTACATALGDELSRLQAEVSRLEKERNAAITRARSREGEIEVMRCKNEETEAKLARRSHSETKIVMNEELRKTRAKLDAANAELERLLGSVRHRAGTLLVDAIRHPGLKTLILPWRLLRLRSGDPSDKARN
ncbi:hypothetical protein [Histidinibacterium aquaticum]|uniref:Sulfotransferase family protein n=1 Tax=Histidinibacterium aquaticum TaxID=2613962 RepID=A0A5J5GAP4_9RHOB|nr:hypothetical protein [Histidinibacterium aquaticum]KAA9005051.1 hypothetical protein F3S47_18655 [Histidinibacterium aquaticum]